MKYLKRFNEEKKSDLTEDDLWQLIEEAEWTSDNDYERISKMYKKLPKPTFKKLKKFYEEKLEDLNTKFEKDWLADPGIEVSDDGWWDLRAEVIGRGKTFYNSITAQKLRKMAREMDYHENFGYSFQ